MKHRDAYVYIFQKLDLEISITAESVVYVAMAKSLFELKNICIQKVSFLPLLLVYTFNIVPPWFYFKK